MIKSLIFSKTTLLTIFLSMLSLSIQASAMELNFNEKTEFSTLYIAPTVTCDCSQILHYQLLASKVSSAGTSTSKQSGSVQTVPNQPQQLSQLSFNLTPDTQYQLQLEIRDNTGTIIAQQSLNTP